MLYKALITKLLAVAGVDTMDIVLNFDCGYGCDYCGCCDADCGRCSVNFFLSTKDNILYYLFYVTQCLPFPL